MPLWDVLASDRIPPDLSGDATFYPRQITFAVEADRKDLNARIAASLPLAWRNKFDEEPPADVEVSFSLKSIDLGPARINFGGELHLTATAARVVALSGVSQTASSTVATLDVEVPETPVQQATAAGWLATATAFGVMIGDHLGHHWLVGGVAGLIAGQRAWNGWVRTSRRVRRNG